MSTGFIQYITTDHFNEERLPKELSVSTISLTFQMNTSVNISNIDKYMTLNMDDICTVQYNGNLRTLLDKKRTKKKTKSYNFQNSITLEVMVRPGKTVHFKLFTNGAVQVAGCKTLEEGNTGFNVLFKRLEEHVAIYNKDTQQMQDISFIEGPINMSSLKINLINVNFDISFHINRDNLYHTLLKQDVKCFYERCKHAAVSIKHPVEGKVKPVSIFVFESGSVVITGSTNETHILEGYKRTLELLHGNKKDIYKTASDSLLEHALKSEKFSGMMMKI
jgi:TATA-box binding protein (TBP) (component of TFIID and TFIIIB)